MVKKIAKTFLGSIRCRLKGMTTSGGGGVYWKERSCS